MAKGDQINPAPTQTPPWQMMAAQNPSYPQSITQQPPYPNMQSPMGPYSNNFYSTLQNSDGGGATRNFGNSGGGQGLFGAIANTVGARNNPNQGGSGQGSAVSMFNPLMMQLMRARQMMPGNGISGPRYLPTQGGGMMHSMMPSQGYGNGGFRTTNESPMMTGMRY